ncbi:hypothetical protein A2U01_0087342, partial [Trifolium medium]|nr:hypothetical protein [Trifolium medium]
IGTTRERLALHYLREPLSPADHRHDACGQGMGQVVGPQLRELFERDRDHHVSLPHYLCHHERGTYTGRRDDCAEY